jgi:predicted nucleotidyltransferase
MTKPKKIEYTLDELIFNTPEQRVLRMLLLEPTTVFNCRSLSSKLKGVRGLGGSEGILKVLNQFKELGIVEFLDSNRSVRLRDDSSFILRMKVIVALCELENLVKTLSPISDKGILFGSRSNGSARSDSDYDVLVVSKNLEEVKRLAQGSPLGKQLELIVKTPDEFAKLEKTDKKFFDKISNGVVLWGKIW